MPYYTAVTGTAAEVAVGVASVQFTFTMAATPYAYYMFVSNTNCWIAQGANPTASAAAGSMFCPANVIIPLNGQMGAKLAVIQDTAGGKATLAAMSAM